MALLLLGSLCARAALLAQAMRANLEEHAEERRESALLGFAPFFPSAAFAAPSTLSYTVDQRVLGMGTKSPFDSDALIHESKTPLFSASECHAIREEAAEHMMAGARSSFTMTDTNRDVSVHELPRTLEWLNSEGLGRIGTLIEHCFGATLPERGMWVYRGLVINYDFNDGLTHQPTHRDASLISCTVPLSLRAEYTGGGTWIEPLDTALVLEQAQPEQQSLCASSGADTRATLTQGHALIHPSAIRHAGGRLHSGERWVLVLFLNVFEMHAAEHGRRLRARAQALFASAQEESGVVDGEEEEEKEEEEEDEETDGDPEDGEEDEEDGEGEAGDLEDEELTCLQYALEMTEETDHEVFYDLGARAHDMGETEEALRMYQRAEALNDRDPLLLSNMGVAHLELGSQSLALRYYRRALAVDRHNVNARFNCGELLLERGRLRGLAALLALAPADVMQQPEMQALARELQLRKGR